MSVQSSSTSKLLPSRSRFCSPRTDSKLTRYARQNSKTYSPLNIEFCSNKPSTIQPSLSKNGGAIKLMLSSGEPHQSRSWLTRCATSKIGTAASVNSALSDKNSSSSGTVSFWYNGGHGATRVNNLTKTCANSIKISHTSINCATNSWKRARKKSQGPGVDTRRSCISADKFQS